MWSHLESLPHLKVLLTHSLKVLLHLHLVLLLLVARRQLERNAPLTIIVIVHLSESCVIKTRGLRRLMVADGGREIEGGTLSDIVAAWIITRHAQPHTNFPLPSEFIVKYHASLLLSIEGESTTKLLL